MVFKSGALLGSPSPTSQSQTARSSSPVSEAQGKLLCPFNNKTAHLRGLLRDLNQRVHMKLHCGACRQGTCERLLLPQRALPSDAPTAEALVSLCIRMLWNSWKMQVAGLHLRISDSVGLGGAPELALLLNSQVILVSSPPSPGQGPHLENWCSGRYFLSSIHFPPVLAHTLIIQSWHYCPLYCRHCLITSYARMSKTRFLA